MKNTVIFGSMAILLSACALREDPEKLEEQASLEYELAHENYIRGDLIPALASTLQSLKTKPDFFEAKNLLGLIYFRQNKFPESEKAFLEASTIEPKRSEVWTNLGSLYYEMKRYQDSLNALNRALENPLYLYPERIYNNIGLVQEALGNQSDAVRAYERAIEFGRDIYLPYNNLGKLQLKLKNNERAKKLLEEAIRLCLDCSEPRYFLGQMLSKENSFEKALKLFKEGASVDPNGYYGQLCARELLKK